jgi:cardiolipin synthase (CMP-forming)
VILVVSRDLMIIGAVMLSWLVGRPVEVKPLLVSKLNTAAQIFFAGLVLGSLGLQFNPGWALPFTMALVAALTLLSVAAYVREWVRHMGSEPG